MERLLKAMRDVVVANRILAHEGVVDAFGHVSVRHPDDAESYIMARSRAPALVTLDDIMVFSLDGEAVDLRGRTVYAERHIHGAIYENRPEVMSVVHNHSHAVIPFGVTRIPIRPLVHMGAAIGAEIPIWDIRDKFGDTNLLVVNMDQGRDLAACLGANRVALMRGHGCAVSGGTVQEAVMNSVYLQVNANLQTTAMAMGEIEYLSPREAELCAETFASDFSVERAWEYLRVRAGASAF